MLVNDMQRIAATVGFRFIDQSATFVPVAYGEWGREVQAFRDGWNARNGRGTEWVVFGNDLKAALAHAAQ